MRSFLIVLAVVLLAAAAQAQINETEVWVGSLAVRHGELAISDLRNISGNHAGYDNQPAFFPDGNTLLYAKQIDNLDDTGLGVQAQLVDLASGATRALGDAHGFSPTPTTDGKQLMLLRQGRVFLHDLAGKEVKPLTDTNDAGYFTPFDDRTWVLFLNNPERPILIYDTRTGGREGMATHATTAPYRIPNARAVTFVAEEDSKRVLRKLDLKTKTVTTLATIPFPSAGQHTWTIRGSVLIASGPTIYEWRPELPNLWQPVYRAEHPDLQGITRIALSPRGDRIALVSTPRDEVVIRNSRAESNRMLAAHRADLASRLFANEATVTAGSGQHYDGRDAIEKSLADRFAKMPGVVYVRTPESIDVSRSDAAASERGAWTARWTTAGGPIEMRGHYSAVWRREISQVTGARSWTIHSEIFVPLDCTGACDRR
ncbi:MAG: hypothetical protein QOH21_1542 [Acidobacteriota bacterium]|jgi:ketosteroid isomerase-like protein|nr:hypothetical protein [Acidobacteriota bacterium]